MPVGIGDFIELSNAAETTDELCDAFEVVIDGYGYDRYMYSMLTGDPLHNWDKAPSILRNYPEDWMSFYIENELSEIDPVREFAFRARGPFVWDDLPNVLDLSERQEQMLAWGLESGLRNGVGVPFHGPFGEVAGIGLASSVKNAEYSRSVLRTIALVCAQFHNVHLHLAYGSSSTSPLRLTPREKEVLSWCAVGKSNWAIGEILSVTEHAVKFHISNCIRKLGVDSRITAVLKAIRLGLIAL